MLVTSFLSKGRIAYLFHVGFYGCVKHLQAPVPLCTWSMVHFAVDMWHFYAGKMKGPATFWALGH